MQNRDIEQVMMGGSSNGGKDGNGVIMLIMMQL
jgi:hypothetical protein